MSTSMEVRFLPNQESYSRMTTAELRKSFVIEHLFVSDRISTVYCDADRAIIGGAIPTHRPLHLVATKKEMAAEYFTERREVGIVNLGGEGVIIAGDQQYSVNHKDMLYIGRGVRNIELTSVNVDRPAVFYFVSFPAHTGFPTKLMTYDKAEKTEIGSTEGANRRTINKYIHMGGIESCQLVMGLTDLAQGSVWNTMPPHTHLRRMEVYLYFGIDPESIVVHLMGGPNESRNVIVRNQQAVISPSWSIHCGAGTGTYSFVWAMGGENQEFSDMDPVSMDKIF